MQVLKNKCRRLLPLGYVKSVLDYERAYKDSGLAFRNKENGNAYSHSDITEAGIMKTKFHATVFLMSQQFLS
jgi:hypothetical protein